MTATPARADTRSAPPAAARPDGLGGRGAQVVAVLSLVGALVGAVLGLLSGPLWLDEAQTVAIARLPLGDLLQGLREDGAPPLYYLLMHAWTAVLGTGEVVVRLPSVLLTGVALLLLHRLARRLGGPALATAALVLGATLPWVVRYASETRQYVLVVVLVLLGTRALLAVHAGASRRAGAALALCVAALLLTHYWSLYLLAVVGLAHLPGLVRRQPAALRVAAAGLLGGVLFLPWLPVFVFQARRTGAPWAADPTVADLLRSPEMWSFGPDVPRIALAVAYVLLAVLAVRRGGDLERRLAGVVVATCVLAWLATVVAGGAYVGRYTAVVVPAVVLLLAAGVVRLPRRVQLPALALLAGTGVVTGTLVAAGPRTQGGEIAEALREGASAGDVVLFCPDQLGPSVARLAPDDLRLLAYPTLEPADRVVWVDYAERQFEASPAAVARRVDELAGRQRVWVVHAPGYRTFGRDCQAVLRTLSELRGVPSVPVRRDRDAYEEQRLYRFGP